MKPTYKWQFVYHAIKCCQSA